MGVYGSITRARDARPMIALVQARPLLVWNLQARSRGSMHMHERTSFLESGSCTTDLHWMMIRNRKYERNRRDTGIQPRSMY